MAGLSMCPLFIGADERKWDSEKSSSLARVHPSGGVSPDSVPPQNWSRKFGSWPKPLYSFSNISDIHTYEINILFVVIC